MASTNTQRLRGTNSSAAIKIACVAATTANITLEAEQTIDGIALVEDDRCLVKDQTDGTENGIYKVATGAWVRDPDFNGSFDVAEGTLCPVSRGTTNANTYWEVSNTGDIVVGTTAITFSQGLVNIAVAATTTVTDESADTTCFPLFTQSATGDLTLHTGSNVTFNSSTGLFTATNLANEKGTITYAELGAVGNTLSLSSGLVIKYVTASTADIDADNLILFDSDNHGKSYSSVNLTIDITASGENGLDTGAEANDTVYTIWAVGKTDGTIAGLLSLSETSPTMPSGYTYKGRIGFAVNGSGGGGDFNEFIQAKDLWSMPQRSVVSAGTAQTFTNVDISAFCPTFVSAVALQYVMSTSSGTDTCGITVAESGSGTTSGLNSQTAQFPSLTTASFRGQFHLLVMSTRQQFAYRLAGTNAQVDLNITSLLVD